MYSIRVMKLHVSEFSLTPSYVRFDREQKFCNVWAGNYGTIARTHKTEHIYVWGLNGRGQLGMYRTCLALWTRDVLSTPWSWSRRAWSRTFTGGSRLPIVTNWGQLPLPFPLLPFPSLFLLFPSPSPSIPLEVGPLNTARRSGGAL